MYALLAEKLWEADELRRIGGSGTSSSGRATGDEVAESANDGRRRGTAAGQPVAGRPWGELPEGLLTALLASAAAADPGTARSVCRGWAAAAARLPLVLSPRVLDWRARRRS